MHYLRRTARGISLLLVMLFGVLSLNTPVYAGMIGTQAAVDEQQAAMDREALLGLLQRDDLRSELQAYGVNPEQARERVAAMSDTEVHALAGKVGDLPSGGDSIIGLAVLIFLVLLFTDILGYTDIFPFVKKTAD